jgi:hypothetical protein
LDCAIGEPVGCAESASPKARAGSVAALFALAAAAALDPLDCPADCRSDLGALFGSGFVLGLGCAVRSDWGRGAGIALGVVCAALAAP